MRLVLISLVFLVSWIATASADVKIYSKEELDADSKRYKQKFEFLLEKGSAIAFMRVRRSSILHLERWTILRWVSALVVDSGGGDVGVPEPDLDLGDIGLVNEGIGGGRGSQRMHAEAVHIDVDTGLLSVVAHNVLVNRFRV